jgi:hypothetical protein
MMSLTMFEVLVILMLSLLLWGLIAGGLGLWP